MMRCSHLALPRPFYRHKCLRLYRHDAFVGAAKRFGLVLSDVFGPTDDRASYLKQTNKHSRPFKHSLLLHANLLVTNTVIVWLHPPCTNSSVYESRVNHLHTLKTNAKIPEEIFEPKANVLRSEPHWLEAGQVINAFRKLWVRH